MPPSLPPQSSLSQSVQIKPPLSDSAALSHTRNVLPAKKEDAAAPAIPPAAPAEVSPPPGAAQPTPESLTAASDPLESLPPRRDAPDFPRSKNPENVAPTSIPSLTSN